MRISLLVLLIFCQSIKNLNAQNTGLGTWNILNIKNNLDDKWSVFGEAQLRSLKFYDNFHYYEYKAAVNYNLNENAKVALGAGSYQTYKEGGDFVLPKNNSEFRLWPQLILLHSFGKLKIEQRYRYELRFTQDGYKNRIRYRPGLIYTFDKEVNGYKPFQLSFSDEIFFTDKEPYFERNRLAFSFNFKPTKATTLQIGYLHQLDYKINDETGRDFLQVGYLVEFWSKKSGRNIFYNYLKDN